MGIIKSLFNKIIWLNVLIAIVLTILIIWISLFVLDSYTNHGETITVPNLMDLTIEEMEEQLDLLSLQYKLQDSTYVVDKPPMVIVGQNPKPLSKVKENRRIYLTLNSRYPPKIQMPDLREKHIDEVMLLLKSKDLKLGKRSYKPGIGENTVLEQKIDGERVIPGSMIYKGSIVDLTLAGGQSIEINTPNLIGLNTEEAENTLYGSNLWLGGLLYDETVNDSSTALVYKQTPQKGQQILMGEAIDIYLTQDSLKLLLDTATVVVDSTNNL